MASYTEDFTGANGTQVSALTNWSDVTSYGPDIQTNAYAPDRNNAEQCTRWSANSFTTDQYAENTLVAKGDALAGPAVRCSGAAETYYGLYGSGTAYMFAVVTGSWSQLGGDGGAWEVNDVIRLTAEGGTITPSINSSDMDIGAQTDDTILSGYAGITAYSNDESHRFDDWTGADIGGAPPSEDFTIPIIMHHRQQLGL